MSPCAPRPTPSIPLSVSRMSTGTGVVFPVCTPLTSPVTLPQSCTVWRLRYPVIFMGGSPWVRARSFLGSSCCHARDEEALREDEDDEHREDRHDGRQCEGGELDRVGAGRAGVERGGGRQQGGEPHLHGVAVARGQHHEGQEEVVPVLHEAEERHQRDDG